MSRLRVMVFIVVGALAAACGTPAGTAAPNPTTAGGGATAAPIPTTPAATTPAGSVTTLPVATSGAMSSVGTEQICATVGQLKTALDALKALDPATASTADLQAKVHDVGQLGVNLMVYGATAPDLRTLNIAAQLIGSLLSSPNATASEKTQGISQFVNTAQKVLDEMAATCG